VQLNSQHLTYLKITFFHVLNPKEQDNLFKFDINKEIWRNMLCALVHNIQRYIKDVNIIVINSLDSKKSAKSINDSNDAIFV
jgi:hypothetical protein